MCRVTVLVLCVIVAVTAVPRKLLQFPSDEVIPPGVIGSLIRRMYENIDRASVRSLTFLFRHDFDELCYSDKNRMYEAVTELLTEMEQSASRMRKVRVLIRALARED